MSYIVSARKYRPQRFSQVVGQESIVETLKNAIRSDRAAHAYLFCGSQGVGKTTLARLFAKALNCQSLEQGAQSHNKTSHNHGKESLLSEASPPLEGGDLQSEIEPCGKCPSCLSIAAGQSLDVIEIDGASHRSIEDVRLINETAAYSPSLGRYKIYLIDEVHMLTKEAFNALLKTLEEPPGRAKFFFATTEPHKVLPTILSRCQRFDLARIPAPQIEKQLSFILDDMSRNATPEALHLISSFAAGSLRDAELLLDQLLCFAPDPIGEEQVRQLLGLAPQTLLFALDDAFANHQIGYACELADRLFQAGTNLFHFFEQLIHHYRQLARIHLLGGKTITTAQYREAARKYNSSQCVYILDFLLNATERLQKSPFPQITLEGILLHLIRSRHRIPVEQLIQRLHELEERLPPEKEVKSPPIPKLTEEPKKPQEVPLEPEPLPFIKAAPKQEPQPVAATPAPKIHSARYDTILRFAGVELEGKVEK